MSSTEIPRKSPNEFERLALKRTEKQCHLPSHGNYLGYSVGKLPPIEAGPVSIIQSENSHVWFDGGNLKIVDQQDNTVVVEGNDYPKDLTRNDSVNRLAGKTLILGGNGARCYYHWMVDILPKLGLLEKAGISLEEIDHFVVRSIHSEFQRSTLQALGIPLSKIYSVNQNPEFVAETIIHVRYYNMMGMGMQPFVPEFLKSSFSPQHKETIVERNFPLVERIRRKLWSKGDVSREVPVKKRLYISRPKGVRRGVSNNDEVEAFLETRGFTSLAMEGLSVTEQAKLLSTAEIVVSPHGGGLTNLVFCKPGTKVIELFGEHIFPYYYGLSNVCDLDYYAYVQNEEDIYRVIDAKTANEHGSNRGQTRLKSFRVELDKLGIILDQICQSNDNKLDLIA